MRSLLALFIALATILAAPVEAQVLSVETYMEQWDPASRQWIRVTEGHAPKAERFLSAHTKPKPAAIAAYGPFRVHDRHSASLVGVTNGASPAQLAALLRDFPEITTLQMIECPGTDDDRANMKLGRMIRAAGIMTHVPAGGSVRSGAVELFLAGARRQIDNGAEFAVHSWLDDSGHQPQHFAADSPENRLYLDYYAEMGMTDADARAFYDMTNSAAHDDAKWLTAQDMRGWIGQSAGVHTGVTVKETGTKIAPAPAIAYLDLGDGFP